MARHPQCQHEEGTCPGHAARRAVARGSTQVRRAGSLDHADRRRADLCLISDTDQFARGLPAITYGLRGLVYEEIFLTGPDHDLHSGGYGGAVPNPANVLCQIIASLHNPDGTVNIPGFYDDVAALNETEKSQWAKLPLDEKKFADDLK